MNIDGITILAMARDGELKPKTILRTFHDAEYFDDNRYYDYYIYFGDNQFHRCDENGKLGAKFQDRFLNYKTLQKEFTIHKIIEEDKEIKHINIEYWDDEEYTPEQRINVCMTTIDELIDEVNKLKRSDK